MFSALRKSSVAATGLRGATRFGFSFGKLVDYAAYHANALKKIINANVFIGTMRIRSGVADAKRRDWGWW